VLHSPALSEILSGVYAKYRYRFMVKFGQIGIQTKLFNIASSI
jgi:hypothetical protein